MEPKQLSQQLRKGQNPNLTQRRFIVGLTMLEATMAEAVRYLLSKRDPGTA